MREATDFIQRRIAAYPAYFENLPIRLSSLPIVAKRRQLSRAFDFGRLLRLNMLDERQYRADQACPKGLRGGGRVLTLAECPDIEAMIGADGTVRELLGEAQTQWLARQLETSNSVWNVLAQGVMMAAIDSRIVPHAGVGKIEVARAEASYTYRVTAGDPEPRKV